MLKLTIYLDKYELKFDEYLDLFQLILPNFKKTILSTQSTHRYRLWKFLKIMVYEGSMIRI